jgi:hypothetical protein
LGPSVDPAVVADHVRPHKGDYKAFRLGALRSLCKACHDGLDRTNNPRAQVREHGSPSDSTPGTPVHKLRGAASRGHLRNNKLVTTSCASFTENPVYVELDGSNAQSQSLSDFLI